MIIKKRTLIHLAFWLISLLGLVWFYTQLTREYTHTLVLAAIVWPVSLVSVYFINIRLIPKYLITKKYRLFGVYTVYTLIVATWITMFFVYLYFYKLITRVGGQGFPFEIDLAFILAGMFLVIASGVLGRAVRENSRMMKEKNDLEMKQLKSQFHPHFLFNTLNNLYSLSLKKSSQTPEMILKLSGLLDYSLYGSERELVGITEEIEFIDNYLDIIQMRFGSRLEIDFLKDIRSPGFQIAPLLLIPFIENATKHGIGPTDKNRIEIKLLQKEHELHFMVINSKPERKPDESHSERIATGLGLNHVKSRLNILYPDKHKLDILENDSSFSINLVLHGKR
jgi:two-component system LytT family sensor kinase